MSVYYLLLWGMFLSGICGETVPEWGFNNYIKYEPGDMNIIITASHGGDLKPSQQANGDKWLDRKDGCTDGVSRECVYTHNCNLTSTECSTKLYRARNTKEVARGLADKIKENTGTRPHVVYNLLHRRKLDTNREINEATFNVPDAITAYQDYAKFIGKAKSAISGRGLLLDIRGHSHDHGLTELGYLISKTKLADRTYRMKYSSIRSLGEFWCRSDSDNDNDVCFQDFVQGKRSLGYFMNNEGLKKVLPSPINGDPDPNVGYNSGGYTTKKYGSRYGGNIDAIQLGFHSSFRSVWLTSDSLKAEANAIEKFCKLNYEM